MSVICSSKVTQRSFFLMSAVAQVLFGSDGRRGLVCVERGRATEIKVRYA